MIRLKKGAEPDWLRTHGAAKTAEYVTAPRGSKPSPWRARAVVEALKAECHEKCMYCEGIVDDVAYSAVEHIRPKVVFPELVLQWGNLGLACTRCNTNKGEYWSEQPHLKLLNPYEDEVELHLQFIGPVVAAAGHSSRGENTIRKLGFSDRPELLISKMKRIQELEVRIARWFNEADDEKKSLFAEDLRDALHPRREFAATLAAYAASRGFIP